MLRCKISMYTMVGMFKMAGRGVAGSKLGKMGKMGAGIGEMDGL